MATVQVQTASFSALAPSPRSGVASAQAEEPDFFATFGALPQFDLSRPFPEFSSSSLPQQQQNQMDLRALQFDPATLDQLMASANAFLPDIDLPSGDFSSFGANNNDDDNTHQDDHFSAGSSPRDDQSHTSGEQHDSYKAGSLAISEEERSMLAASGVVIPTDALTLTKAEEKALKSVRRRLRNKISAQDSRRKKKEYVDGLEQRVASCTAVNIEMQSRVNTLAHENRSLKQQLLQLKEMVAKLGGPNTAATTGTILMVLALSFSMFVNPLSSSVAANATTLPTTDTPLPSAGSRTLKALPSSSSRTSTTDSVAPPPPLASLRGVLSTWLSAQKKREEDDESQAPPSLQPHKRAGAP